MSERLVDPLSDNLVDAAQLEVSSVLVLRDVLVAAKWLKQRAVEVCAMIRELEVVVEAIFGFRVERLEKVVTSLFHESKAGRVLVVHDASNGQVSDFCASKACVKSDGGNGAVSQFGNGVSRWSVERWPDFFLSEGGGLGRDGGYDVQGASLGSVGCSGWAEVGGSGEYQANGVNCNVGVPPRRRA